MLAVLGSPLSEHCWKEKQLGNYFPDANVVQLYPACWVQVQINTIYKWQVPLEGEHFFSCFSGAKEDSCVDIKAYHRGARVAQSV